MEHKDEMTEYFELIRYYREKGEEREIVKITSSQKGYLLNVLHANKENSIHIVNHEKNDITYRKFAFNNIPLLNKYIELLRNETIELENGDFYVPFFPEYEKDLFMFLLNSIDGKVYVI